MIRGPVLPQGREALWALVAGRLDTIERGLRLVAEAFDCSGGQLGAADGLARDAAGAPVLVLLATDGDALLTARALGAAAFLERAGDALPAALPEAELCPGVPGRVLVVAADGGAAAADLLGRLALPSLQVCRLEPFRVQGTERFAVRWCKGAAAAALPAATLSAATPELALPPALQPLWHGVQTLCTRIDAGVRVDGDRYRRRISWQGRTLAEVALADDGLLAHLPDAPPRPLATASDVRRFVDQVLRGYARAAGLRCDRPDAAADANGAGASLPRARPARAGDDTLRSALAATRLTPEEYCALGAPASSAGHAEPAGDAADRAVGAAHGRSRPAPERTD